MDGDVGGKVGVDDVVARGQLHDCGISVARMACLATETELLFPLINFVQIQ